MHMPPAMLLALLSLCPALAPHDQPAASADTTTTSAPGTAAPAGPLTEPPAEPPAERLAESLADPAAEPLAAPLPVVALDDELEFLMILEDPDVRTDVVGIVEYGDRTFVAAVHEFVNRSRGVGTWAVVYTFPPTIFTHSIVQVPFHAEEMK